MTVAHVAQSAAFVPARAGYRFRIESRPARAEPVGTVVFVHGFAEELNKSRRMVALAARRLAADGWRVVQRDLQGCGDSAGDFADATREAWIEDVQEEVLGADHDRPVWLWCLRAGALLAAPVLGARPDLCLLLWQPVLSGDQHLRQYLRLQAGARIVGSSKADAASPLERLRDGAEVEVGGYRIHPSLAAGMRSARFDVPLTFRGRVAWMELSSQVEDGLPPSSAGVVEGLRARGVDARAVVLAGPPFWQTQELAVCPELVDRTAAAIVDGVGSEHGTTRESRSAHQASLAKEHAG